MTVFDTRGRARYGRLAMVVAVVIVAYLIVVFIAWEMASELSFTSTVTTPMLPGEVADSATSPVTSVGK